MSIEKYGFPIETIHHGYCKPKGKNITAIILRIYKIDQPLLNNLR